MGNGMNKSKSKNKKKVENGVKKYTRLNYQNYPPILRLDFQNYNIIIIFINIFENNF